MTSQEEADREYTSRLLLRELRMPHNTRFLRAMPGFRVEDDTPTPFMDLLERLERAEFDGGNALGAARNPER